MRYKSFRIRNFKGIKDATISLDNLTGASVFALVGLNESGKTTLLEAIHSFSPDAATSELLGGDDQTGVPYKDRVPRHQISTFTGTVSVAATLALTDDDKQTIAETLLEEHALELNTSEMPLELVLERSQKFENGDFQISYFNLPTKLTIKNPKQRRWRAPDLEELVKLRDVIYELTPDIAYFPSFVFDFPQTVFLSERGGVVDQFYRTVFQDILDYDGHCHEQSRRARRVSPG